MQGVRFLGKKGGTPRAVFPLPRALGEGCLESRRVPARAPQDSRARWTPGRGVRVDKVGGGRGTPGLPYLARPAPARREAERSRGRAVPAPARSPARRLCALRPPARSPRRFQSQPAPPPARPAPGPSSVPPHSRSSPPNPASASLQTPPPLRALRPRLGFSAGPLARSCPPRGAESPGAAALRRSRCLPAPSGPQSDCVPESSRHGARGWEGH